MEVTFGNFKVYCDESGNSGTNFLDLQQPVHVLAGWIIPDNAITTVNKLVINLKQTLKTQAVELHGVRVLKSRRGQKATLETFKALIQKECMPIFIIAEKRYCVAATIVETFLDPVYNPIVTNEITWDLPVKQHIANILCDVLPLSYMSDFWLAYRSLNTEKLRGFLTNLILNLLLQLHTNLADLFSGAIGYVDQIVRDTQGACNRYEESGFRSLNLTILINFFIKIEDFGRSVGAKDIHIIHVIHDETREFEMAFRKVFKNWKNGEPTDMIFPGNIKLILGFESLKTFRTIPSHSSPLVQSADLLARSLYMYANKTISKENIDKELSDLVELIVAGLLVTKPLMCDIVGSKSFMRELF